MSSCIIAQREELIRWFVYQNIGYVYESTENYKVFLFLLGSIFSQQLHDFVMSPVIRNL